MTRFVVGDDRSQSTLFPERLEDYLSEDNPVRAIDVFVDELDLARLGFGGVEPEATGRPAYHPATLLKIYVYGYLNRVQSSRRLERECQRNIELVWLTYHATVDVPARFRNSKAVGAVFGLTPSRYQSGEIDRPGAISRCGDEMMRAMLYEAAHIMLVRLTKWSWLKAWAMKIARHRGMKKAIVALARRLAVIMHRIWVDGTEFRWTREQAAAA